MKKTRIRPREIESEELRVTAWDMRRVHLAHCRRKRRLPEPCPGAEGLRVFEGGSNTAFPVEMRAAWPRFWCGRALAGAHKRMPLSMHMLTVILQTCQARWRRRDALPFPSRAVYMPMPSHPEPDRAKERLHIRLGEPLLPFALAPGLGISHFLHWSTNLAACSACCSSGC